MKDTTKNCATESVSAPSAFTGRQRVGRFDRIEDILDPDARPMINRAAGVRVNSTPVPTESFEGCGER